MIRYYSLCLIMLLFLSSDGIAQTQDIIGSTTPVEIRETHRIFDIYINRYSPDSAAVAFLSNFDESIDIKIFFGTWCHDSKREIPAFIKTMELVENPKLNIEYIGVSRKKTELEGITDIYDLQYTPTFIIFSAEKEIGRIVEESTESIEQDLVRILKSGDFKDD